MCPIKVFTWSGECMGSFSQKECDDRSQLITSHFHAVLGTAQQVLDLLLLCKPGALYMLVEGGQDVKCCSPHGSVMTANSG